MKNFTSGPLDRRVIVVLNFSELHVITCDVGQLIGELFTHTGQKFVNSFKMTNNIKWCPY